MNKEMVEQRLVELMLELEGDYRKIVAGTIHINDDKTAYLVDVEVDDTLYSWDIEYILKNYTMVCISETRRITTDYGVRILLRFLIS